MQIAFVIGIVMSLAVALFARRVGLDRDRAFYPTILIVIASTYVLFAAMSGSASVFVTESIVMMGFSTVAVRGFTSSPWVIAIGLAGHGVFDAFHGQLYTNPGVPSWWPAFCSAYDVGAAAGLAWLLRGSVPATGVRS